MDTIEAPVLTVGKANGNEAMVAWGRVFRDQLVEDRRS